MPGDPALRERDQQRLRRIRRRRDRHRQRHDERDARSVSTPALGEEVVHQQRGLARRGRALERRRRDRHDDATAVEVRQHVAQRERAGHRVELVAPFDQTGCRGGIEIGAERDDEDVGVEATRVGVDVLRHRIDRRHGRLHETHARLHDVGVRSGAPPPAASDRTSRRASRSRTRRSPPCRSTRCRRRSRTRPTVASSAPDHRTPRPTPRSASREATHRTEQRGLEGCGFHR